MRYFTKQLWIDLQQPDENGDVSRRWDEAFAAYARQLETLRDRVPPDVFAFFQNAEVHDASLIHLRLQEFDPLAPKPPKPDPAEIDACGEDCGGEPWEGPYPLRVELSVAEWTAVEWTLRYSGIRRVLVDFPSGSPLFFYAGMGFSDWGYHELSDAGDGFLRHEVLFSSGSVFLIEFRELSVTRFDRAAS